MGRLVNSGRKRVLNVIQATSTKRSFIVRKTGDRNRGYAGIPGIYLLLTIELVVRLTGIWSSIRHVALPEAGYTAYLADILGAVQMAPMKPAIFKDFLDMFRL